MTLIDLVSRDTNLAMRSVKAVLELFAQDCTVPFIARYRKEVTGNLDEVQILLIRDTAEKIQTLEKRRETVLASLKESNSLTPELEAQIQRATTLSEVEDLYLPYRPKRRTRATVALEKGLEGLALSILANVDPADGEIDRYVLAEKGVANRDEALQGARDIVAERLCEAAAIRGPMRTLLAENGMLTLKKARGATEQSEFKDFFDKSETLHKIPSHRLLAILRGEVEGQLSYKLEADEARVVSVFAAGVGFKPHQLNAPLNEAVVDGWKRLLQPSLETEMVATFKLRADEKAIDVFAQNLRELLMAAPLGQKALLAVDPGLRTGCKVVVLSAQGALLEHGVIYPLEPFKKTEDAKQKILEAVKKYHIEAVAVGNGTGGRESFDFVRGLGLNIPILSVSESGASVYSASPVAREEFPDQDVTVRGAVSIGRRLMDPLAELVKVDPKAIGVGQYQHDVDQKLLKTKLEDTVASCVNSVGVDANTASGALLATISGLNTRLATALVTHRSQNGPFRSRKEFLKIKGFGPKAFEQAAGFLRIRNAENPLDASAVHPESYPIVDQIAVTLGIAVKDLIGRTDVQKRISEKNNVTWQVGAATLSDILKELQKPGLDPRQEFEAWEFDPKVRTIDDLFEGQILNAIITNVTDFGAFADIGVHQDGLIHISQLSDAYVKNPMEVVKVGQRVKVKVLAVEKARKRISLSRKELTQS